MCLWHETGATSSVGRHTFTGHHPQLYHAGGRFARSPLVGLGDIISEEGQPCGIIAPLHLNTALEAALLILRSDQSPSLDDAHWNAFVAAHPTGHLLQLSQWGALKTRFGWQAVRLALGQDGELRAGAQLLFRRLPLGRTLAYVPKGPVMDFHDEATATQLWAALHQLARAQRAILLKVEPELPDDPALAERLRGWGFRPSLQTIQPRRTIWVDLTAGETDILARMKSKTRYNVRLAARQGVEVRGGSLDDWDAFYALMQTTGMRDDFGIRSREYYQTAYQLLSGVGLAQFFLASYDGEPVAALLAFVCGDKAVYFAGASSNRHRNRMPNYLLQWEAMRWAKAQGCTVYDLWGIPDEDEATLEAQFTERRDGLWGVYRFKRGFGGQAIRYLGAYDYVYSTLWYRLYMTYVLSRGSSDHPTA
jgi:peptidoglycan pentaglycine glycine transferase (the first glycine)